MGFTKPATLVTLISQKSEKTYQIPVMSLRRCEMLRFIISYHDEGHRVGCALLYKKKFVAKSPDDGRGKARTENIDIGLNLA